MSGGADEERDAFALSSDENADLCSGCIKCCTYITVEIDAPRAAWEYDQWSWALHHEAVGLFLEKPERWFLHFDAKCSKLQPNGKCGIYGRHPRLCREYDPRSCERRLPLADIVAWFHTAEEFETWVREKRPRHWQRLEAYRKPPAGAPGSAESCVPSAGFIPLQALAMTGRTKGAAKPASRNVPKSSASRTTRRAR